MTEQAHSVWVSIRDGQIVGTPFGPEVPNGKYCLAGRLDSEGGGSPASPDLYALAIQYRDDMRHPPNEESRERRIKVIEAALSPTEDGPVSNLADPKALHNKGDEK